ncbi:FadR/GntR family transcriptional regulator [Paenibacillus piri]|uniref:FadR family transcriptional regulator n=1 Tax=Paenibacillus piri TaxID=2547395 RepID=A0A4V6PII8_9BACL|nr:FadR/GntR family transcriptional regulator [Paenibacillus piri]TDF98044.1 FadR family transcriptional regulator [Paenibacillus piri]
MFKSINEERKTFSRKVVEHIKELIVSGQLKPGDKLPAERELAEKMDVSRPTIREAFKILSAVGLLDIKQGSGVYVAAQSMRLDNLASILFMQSDSIHELFEVRKMIEAESAAKAAICGTAEFLEEIYQMTSDSYNKVIVNPQFATQEERETFLSESDQRFHIMIAEAAGNEVVVRIMMNLIDLLKLSRMQSMKIPGRVEQSLKEHMMIARMLKENNMDSARSCMIEHLASVETDLLVELNHATKEEDSVE